MSLSRQAGNWRATPAHPAVAGNLFLRSNGSHQADLGGACRDRTDDPLLAKQVLSQLS